MTDEPEVAGKRVWPIYKWPPLSDATIEYAASIFRRALKRLEAEETT
jgi:hypothetical protein